MSFKDWIKYYLLGTASQTRSELFSGTAPVEFDQQSLPLVQSLTIHYQCITVSQRYSRPWALDHCWFEFHCTAEITFYERDRATTVTFPIIDAEEDEALGIALCYLRNYLMMTNPGKPLQLCYAE